MKQVLSSSALNFSAHLLFSLIATNTLAGDGAVERFRMLESTAFLEKQAMIDLGFEPIEELGSFLFWPQGEVNQELPSKVAVCEVLQKVGPEFEWIVLDIEHWNLSTKYSLIGEIEENIRKFHRLIDWTRECAPKLQIGFYGQFPISEHSSVLADPGQSAHQRWLRDNTRLSGLAARVDAIFPSLYTSTEDVARWTELAEAYMSTARSIAGGKPVFPYLWPRYHQGAPDVGGQFLPPEYWDAQLSVVLRLADGFVLWGGWKNGPENWDPRASWWQVTVCRMGKIGHGDSECMATNDF